MMTIGKKTAFFMFRYPGTVTKIKHNPCRDFLEALVHKFYSTENSPKEKSEHAKNRQFLDCLS